MPFAPAGGDGRAQGIFRMRVSRRSEIASFQVMDVMSAANALAAKGVPVFHLEAGEPGGPTPKTALEAAGRALAEGRIGYTEPLGLRTLRARIAAYYGTCYDIDLAPSRVIVTVGASAGFILAFLVAFDAGARIGVGLPGYPAYTNIAKVLGLEPVPLVTTQASHFQPTPGHIENAGRLDGLIIQSPANPTGAMLEAEPLARLCTAARDTGTSLISDEIYHGITFGKAARTALQFDEEAIIINSFSKYFCMTGWRVGWMVVPEALVRPIERIAQNLFISPNAVSQHAALAAFDAAPELDARVAGYGVNRDILLGALAQAGVADVFVPDGGFYLYCDVSRLTHDSEGLCQLLLKETGVAATPGTDFDPIGGRTALRLSFAGDRATIEQAATALAGWLKARGQG